MNGFGLGPPASSVWLVWPENVKARFRVPDVQVGIAGFRKYLSERPRQLGNLFRPICIEMEPDDVDILAAAGLHEGFDPPHAVKTAGRRHRYQSGIGVGFFQDTRRDARHFDHGGHRKVDPAVAAIHFGEVRLVHQFIVSDTPLVALGHPTHVSLPLRHVPRRQRDAGVPCGNPCRVGCPLRGITQGEQHLDLLVLGPRHRGVQGQELPFPLGRLEAEPMRLPTDHPPRMEARLGPVQRLCAPTDMETEVAVLDRTGTGRISDDIRRLRCWRQHDECHDECLRHRHPTRKLPGNHVHSGCLPSACRPATHRRG